MAALRQDRRSDKGRFLAVGAAEFFAPGTVLVNLSVGDGHGFVGPPVTAVVLLGDSDVFFQTKRRDRGSRERDCRYYA